MACVHCRRPLPAASEPLGLPAAWGQVCIALLVHRCSDKAPSVRARAVANLAALVEAVLIGKPGSMGEQPGAVREVNPGLASS